MSNTVLVCDDAMFMRTFISKALTEADYEIVGEAENGHQAVEQYKQLKPDVVIMDLVMPDMDGMAAVREIVKCDPKARILICSAMGQKNLMNQAVQAGAREFLVKPFQPMGIVEAVQRTLA